MKITFYGGARSVTGANYLLEVNKKKYLIECGLTQGGSFSESQNYQPFSYDAGEIEAVFITHAHIDHIGLLPKLVKEGFSGTVYSTLPTKDLTNPMLKDAFKIMNYEAERSGRKMLYGLTDINKLLSLFKSVNYGEKIKIDEQISVRFRDAGHILGSAIIEIWAQEKRKKRKIVFSGDLGNPPTPLLRPTEFIKEADYILVESTYGDKLHENKELRKGLLEDAIEETISSGGVLMIPTFALERTQEILYELNELVENCKIPRIPIFIDSPLAIKLTDIYKKYPEYYNKEAKYLIASGDEIFHFPGLQLTKSVEESKKINNVPAPKVIIAGSGMSNGGRILHHERRYLSDPKTLLLIISYQSAGSLGRRLFEGEKSVKIFSRPIQVRCKIKAIGGYSAHPDKKGLLTWIESFDKPVKKIFVVQGEEDASLSLVNSIQDDFGIDAIAPLKGDSIILN